MPSVVKSNNTSSVIKLLSVGADANATDQEGHVDIVNSLIRFGASINAIADDGTVPQKGDMFIEKLFKGK